MAQQGLSENLDCLIAKLRSIEEIQETSPQFDLYVHKLINIKHKVTVVYSVLQTAQVCHPFNSFVAKKNVTIYIFALF